MIDDGCYHKGFFQTAEGLSLYEQAWRPSAPIAAIIIVHGYAEHGGRYQWIASQLIDHGFAIYVFDLRGHGDSQGERGFVRSFQHYLSDLGIFLQRVQAREPSKPIFLLGHSMGGAIAALFTIDQKPMLSGLILSSGILGVSQEISPFLVRATLFIGRLIPKLPTLFVDSSAICRDSDVVKSYETDPLVYHGRTPARTSAEILEAITEIQARNHELELPLLVLHGTADRLASTEGSKALYRGAGAKDKFLKLYEGLYHELLNEPEKMEVLFDIEAWLTKHLPTG